jgi:hypothetical protein
MMLPLVGLLCAAVLAGATPARHIVAEGGPVEPGTRATLVLRPAIDPSQLPGPLHWMQLSGPPGLGDGFYRAPYRVTPDRSGVRIRVAYKDASGALHTVAEDEIALRPGVFPGSDSCAGVGQDHLPAPGEYVFTDELPVAVSTPSVEYPAAARARGIRGVLIINALVCVVATGRHPRSRPGVRGHGRRARVCVPAREHRRPAGRVLGCHPIPLPTALVSRDGSDVQVPRDDRGRWQGATTTRIHCDTRRRSNAASGHEGSRDVCMTSVTGH